MRVTLVLTHQCNLACSYCYSGEKFDRHMEDDVAWKALNLAFQHCGDEPLTVSFFGGEPLLEFDRMVRWTRLALKMAQKRGKEIEFSVTTNATILSDKILDFFERYPFHVAWSVDGIGDDHDKHRPFVSGRASSDLVWKNLEKVGRRLRRTSIHLVVNPDTVAGVPAAVERLVDMGFWSFTLLPNMEATWTYDAQQVAERAYTELATYYLQQLANGRGLIVSPFSEQEGGGTSERHCGFGIEDVAVAPTGNLYPCARLVGEDNRDEIRLGDVCGGIDEAKVKAMRAKVRAKLTGCGVDSPCGCVAIMPGNSLTQLHNTEFFRDLTDQVWQQVAYGEAVSV